MKVITRFAPSPTGELHIGGARTALFNWLYAKNNGGDFLIRIEDTDKKRLKKGAIKTIVADLNWLGIKSDKKPIIQSDRLNRHIDIIKKLLQEKSAFFCYCYQTNIDNYSKQKTYYKPDIQKIRVEKSYPSVRLEVNKSVSTNIGDLIQGKISIDNKKLDDMVLMRSDGSPTYMLSVVVDDYDMKVSHLLRGDDHLTNTFRQYQIYKKLGWQTPHFGHMPLIHDSAGSKMSKRNEGSDVAYYRNNGFLNKSIFSYLLRLGWSHGDEEIISRTDAVQWFNTKSIGKSPSRFNNKKLLHINKHYISREKPSVLYLYIIVALEKDLNRIITKKEKMQLLKGMCSTRKRSSSLDILKNLSKIYLIRPKGDIISSLQTVKIDHVKDKSSVHLKDIIYTISNIAEWKEVLIEQSIRRLCADKAVHIKEIARLIRLSLTYSEISPSIFEIMHVVGRKES